MKNHDNYIMPVIVIGLAALFVGNIFWLFNKQPLTENTEVLHASSDVLFYYSESVTENRGDEGIYYLDEIYEIKADLNDDRIKNIIAVMNQIKSRKRESGQGNILTHITGMSKLYIEFYIGDDYYNYIFTDRDSIMRCHSPHTGKIISITLNDGDFETLSGLIKQYGTKQ